MKALKAHVRGGRVVLDEPNELPDGTEVELTVIEDDDFEPGERARLDASLELSAAQADGGQLVGHLADSNVMLCSMALGEKKEPWTVEKTKTSKADLVKGIALFGFDTTRFALVGLITGHEFEHHGNMVTHMRMKGLVPPSSEPPPPQAPAPK